MKKDIYIIKNDINSKVYIGQAKNAKERFQSHCKPSASHRENELIAKAIHKYGKKHFHYEIIESQIEDYDEKEIFYIKQYNSLVPNGYNILSGGSSPPQMAGIVHPEAKLTAEQVEDLTSDLKNTEESFDVLTKKYGFKSRASITEFNLGQTYVRNISYPIRKMSIGKLKEDDVTEIIKILKYTYRNYKDIAEQYNVEFRVIRGIDIGERYHRPDIKYPIRNWRYSRKSTKLTYEQVTDIIYLLMNTSLSLREIAKQYFVEYKDILYIKNGSTKMYRREGLTYPLRPNN